MKKMLTAHPLTVYYTVLTAQGGELLFVNGYEIVNGVAVNGIL